MTIPTVPQERDLTALSGPALLRWLATDPRVAERSVSDGRHTVSYAETAEMLDELERRAEAAGLTRGLPLALECSQSVPGALALMFVLSRGHDVVLLPELADSAKETGIPRFIPSFCSHVMTASAAKSREAESPLDAILLAANDAFVASPVVAAFSGPPDLYLRTSGSTGSPKLTRMSHQAWLNNGLACVERWALTAADRLSVPVPIFHSYGFGAAFIPGLLAGCSMDVGSGGNILRYLEREEQFDPNVAFLTPALCDMFLAVRKTPRFYRLTVTAGDKIKRETMAGYEPRFGPILNLYGSAEMGAVSAASPEIPAEIRLGTAGTPLCGIELRCEDAGEGLEVEPGAQTGRLQCRQENGTVGYLIQDEGIGTDPTWRFEPRARDGWFETGDLATLRPDGYLEVLGRSGLSVKRDGLLVVFADVEAAVERVEGVVRAVVVAAGESRRGARLVAVCLRGEAAAELDPDAVRRQCFDHLPRYAVPDAILLVEELPHLPSGKVDRRAVRELALA